MVASGTTKWRERTTYEEGHKLHGEIHHFNAGEHVRTTYDKDKFDKDHKLHGVIHHREGGKHVRTTYDSDHELHGQVHHFENGKLVKRKREDENQCGVCLAEHATYTFVPCGHKVLCKKCANLLSAKRWDQRKCVVCRAPFSITIEIFD